MTSAKICVFYQKQNSFYKKIIFVVIFLYNIRLLAPTSSSIKTAEPAFQSRLRTYLFTADVNLTCMTPIRFLQMTSQTCEACKLQPHQSLHKHLLTS